MKHFTQLILIGLAALLGACNSISDPAVRLADCLEEAVKEQQAEAVCDLGVAGGCVVILHPDGTLSDAQLLDAGLTPERAARLRELRLNEIAGIYVLPDDPQLLPSRTTSQHRFLLISRILVLAKPGGEPLRVVLGGPASNRSAESLR